MGKQIKSKRKNKSSFWIVIGGIASICAILGITCKDLLFPEKTTVKDDIKIEKTVGCDDKSISIGGSVENSTINTGTMIVNDTTNNYKKMNTFFYKTGFLMCLFAISISAIAQIKVDGDVYNSLLNTGIIIYNSTTKIYSVDKKLIDKLKTVDEINAKMDTLLAFMEYLKLQEEKNCTQLAQKDSTIVIDKDSIKILKENNQKILVEKQTIEQTILLLKQKEMELQNKKFNYLPFGVHQFTTKQTGKGILFSTTEVGLLGAGVGCIVSANINLRKHKDPKYEDWERDRFHDQYEKQLNTAGWFFASTGLMIALNYCDNFNWFRHKINDSTSATIVPAPMFDWQGKPQITMTINVNF